MKQLITSFLFTASVLIAASCGNDHLPKTTAQNDVTDTAAYIDPGSFDFDTICGMYSGQFGDNELRLVINYASEGHAVGYNIVKGLQRNICGKVKLLPETVEMELSEPGDDKNDGVFKLTMNRSTLTLTGTWTPNNKQLKPKTFMLERFVVPKENDVMTAANFALYLRYLGDTSGNYLSFEADGYCTYEYYPGNNNFNQKEEINGTWSFRDQKAFIEWQPNPVFPDRTSVFNLTKDENEQYTLEGEGTIFTVYYF